MGHRFESYHPYQRRQEAALWMFVKSVLLFEIQMSCAIVLEECVQTLLREGVTLEAKIK